MAQIVTLRSREASLKRRLRRHLRELGFSRGEGGRLAPPDFTKDTYRAIHAHQRLEKLERNRKWIEMNAGRLMHYFASGTEIDPARIKPRLELTTKGTEEADVFRLAGLYWRIPISEGYGRRMRFLVWDDYCGKLIGLLALGDAVFNLKVRDELIGWDHHRRAQALVHMMDAYVLGAVPPYNMLLGGKLVASLAKTRDVVDHFADRYRNSIGVISGEKKGARLVAVTTSSALGRSSIYNRLKIGGELLFRPIGYTSGWGHFHIPDEIFADMRHYLAARKDKYADGFGYGQGPNWKMRALRKGLSLLDMNPDLICHGLPREVFWCDVANNATAFLRGDHVRVRYPALRDVEETGELVKERWMLPRAARDARYREWRSENFLAEILGTLDRVVGDNISCDTR